VFFLGCGHDEYVRITSPDHPTVKAFNASKSLIPVWSKNVQPPVHEWNEVLNVGEKLTLRVSALQTVGGKFYGQYSDEQESRLIGNPGDYVYPCALRFDAANSRVFGVASGLAAGIQQATILFEFDTRSRQLIHTYHVDPKLLPPEPAPLAKAP